MKGRVFSEEHRKKIGEANSKRVWSEESKRKVSENHAKPFKGKTFSSEHKKKLKENNAHYWKDKTHSDEYKKKMSIALSGENHPLYGTNVPQERKDKIRKSLLGFRHSDETKKKMRLIAIERIQNRVGQLSPGYNPNAIPIIEQKAKEYGIDDLQHAETPGGEFYIEELGYWVDGYSEEKNIVIEYYEKWHEKKKERDERRKNEIIKHLGCEFIIIKE
jgi:hypothetical protein